MDSILKKIFSGKIDGNVHGEFVKYSKGSFPNKYLIEAKRQKDRWAIKTNADLANFLVARCLELSPGEVQVKGVIVTTSNLSGMAKFPLGNVKQFMGIKQTVVDTKTDSRNILELMEKFPKAFFALSFSAKDLELKTKAKAPKSAKPSARGEKEPKVDFCSLKTSRRDFVDDLFFDIKDFGEASAKHTLEIKEIILPKGESDPVKIRERAERKGKIIRLVKADGKEVRSEKDFIA